MTETDTTGAATPTIRRCGTMTVHHRLLASEPGYAAARASSENRASAAGFRAAARTGVTTIPVVVHVVYNTATQNISDAQIQSQLDVLNRDYRKTNTDFGHAPAAFQPLGADARVEFRLATTDPSGNPTTGIERRQTTVASFSDDDAVKRASSGGMDAWPADRYLNIWVCQLGGGLLGYAQFPGGPAATDGVVILHSGFGTSGTAAAPFNLGRTATHEIGHWLNLHHIWGDDGTGCTGSDLVDDTPNQGGPNFGKPAFPHLSCSNGPNGDMFMDYMDYVDDDSMVMFSTGQVARMQTCLDTDRPTMGTSSGTAKWSHNDLVAAAGAPAAVGPPSGYTWNVDFTQHVVYRGVDNHVHELWFNGAWNHNDLVVAAGAPPAAGTPHGYTWDVDRTQHVVYQGSDNHIHELWFNGAWNHNDLVAAAGAPPAAGEPHGYTWAVDSTQHVVYQGSDNHVHELWFNGAWNHNDLTIAAGAPATASAPWGYTWDVDSTQHVVYRGADNHVHELWFNGAWNHNDLTVAAGAPATVGPPRGYTWSVDSTQHVVYQGSDNHVHELWFNGAWNHNDLTVAAGAPNAAGQPFGYTWDVDSTQHVVYQGSDSHVHELWFNGVWNHNDLTVAAAAPTTTGAPFGYTWDVDRTQHVVFQGGDNHIHELWFSLNAARTAAAVPAQAEPRKPGGVPTA